MSAIYVVFTNTDLTEGRGIQVPIAWSRNKYTAQRLAKGSGVQGSNADLHLAVTEFIRGKEYIKVDYVPLQSPSKEDEIKQKQMEDRDELVAKMKALGVTDEMLQGLGVKE
jgi:hypothetical protein